MGYEAYKITAKIQNLSTEDMIAALRENGAMLTEKFGDTVTMEISTIHGVIELVLREVGHVNVRFSPWEKVLLSIRFAKANDARIIDEIIALLKKLSAKFTVLYIRDMETNSDIDLSDTAWLIQAVTYAKYDFEYYFRLHRHNVRCREVFCICGSAYPQLTAEKIS